MNLIAKMLEIFAGMRFIYQDIHIHVDLGDFHHI